MWRTVKKNQKIEKFRANVLIYNSVVLSSFRPFGLNVSQIFFIGYFSAFECVKVDQILMIAFISLERSSYHFLTLNLNLCLSFN